ncbi:hypothetical protein RJ639_006030 [Escallonia herrerae]|uniref:NAF domain-containing protein n=1 Tax=Escallonia herrerae TaxID=1293975 RepID=A0AA88VVY3_9ASTE|nr:hypothetical protein RJ639_006030 [Escallonia herrerae]
MVSHGKATRTSNGIIGHQDIKFTECFPSLSSQNIHFKLGDSMLEPRFSLEYSDFKHTMATPSRATELVAYSPFQDDNIIAMYQRFTGEISSACRGFSSDAWQLVTKSVQFDLSPLFEDKKREEMRFAIARPASSMISKLEEVAKEVKFSVKKSDSSPVAHDNKVGPSHPDPIAMDISSSDEPDLFQLHSSSLMTPAMVEMLQNLHNPGFCVVVSSKLEHSETEEVQFVR